MAKSWCNLAEDIISLVIKRLSYRDHIRFRAVCKNWRDFADATDAHAFVRRAEKLPWIMAYNATSCFLYDPSHRRQYPVFNNDKNREETFANAIILDSKNEWALFSQWTTSSVFFYNPFTDNIIQLPKLDLTYRARFRGFMRVGHKATFSTSPVSSDCVIFVIREKKNEDSRDFSICICKPGDTIWTELFFNGRHGDFIEDVEYMGGVFYCTFGQLGIGAFNVTLNEWKLHPFPYPCPLIEEGVYRCWDRLIECNGYLLLSHLITVAYKPQYSSWWNFLRLDESSMNWSQVESWDNRSLFLGLSSIAVPVQQEELANTMHFLTNWPYAQQIYESSASFCPQISQLYDWKITGFTKFWIQQYLFYLPGKKKRQIF